MMSNPADFVDAHGRHWQDAEILFGQDRWANADQLYGFSAECGLKAVMEALGMNVDAIGRPEESKHRKHIQDLWPIFQAFARERNGASYLSMLPSGSPFADWSHHDRYAHQSYCQERDTLPHRAAAKRVRPLVQQARRNSVP